MAKRKDGVSIWATSKDGKAVADALGAARLALNPKQMYLVKGQWIEAVFEGGAVVELHPGKCVVVMVLEGAGVAELPKGALDVSELVAVC